MLYTFGLELTGDHIFLLKLLLKLQISNNVNFMPYYSQVLSLWTELTKLVKMDQEKAELTAEQITLLALKMAV